MDELEIKLSEKAKEIKQKIEDKKNNEGENVVKDRMKKVLSERDKAMKQIYEYQDETGVPTQDETDEDFLGMSTNKN
jgi:F420-0:gamma-glutamyl ligase